MACSVINYYYPTQLHANILMAYSNLVVLTMRISFPSASWITRGVVDAMTLPNDLCLGEVQVSGDRYFTS